MRRSSPSDKKKTAEISDVQESRTSEHVNVIFDNADEYDDNSDDTEQLVRREDNEHAIS